MYSTKPDYEKAQARMDAFWNHDETDRPLVLMPFPKKDAKPFAAKKSHPSHQDYWLDIEYRAEEAVHQMENTVFYADSMPVFMPNLGPEILSAWAGCPYRFGEHTTWSEPCILDWEKDTAVIDTNHPLAKKMETFTQLLLEKAKGKFIVGLTDFHPGGDHLAALRDPQNLALDLLEQPDRVKAMLASSYKEYFPIFDYYANMIKAEGMPLSTWLPLTAEDCMYVPCNDFSCMISKEMFDEFFLEGITDECRHFSKSIYHLDGPDAIRHLDSILAIPELNAIQWVPSVGEEACHLWLDLFKQILAAKKSLLVEIQTKNDLKFLMDNFPAKGLGIAVRAAGNEENAKGIMDMINKHWAKS